MGIAFVSLLLSILNACAYREDELPRIAAPIVYKDLMLVITCPDLIAAIVFDDEINSDTDKGVKYRFRCLDAKTGNTRRGSGLALESYKKAKNVDTGKLEYIDLGSVLRIKADKIEIEWGYQSQGRGWIYYLPENVHVQIAHKHDFEGIMLDRFKRR